MNWTLEVIVIPVSDLDRAKDFYHDKVGFPVDFDQRHGDSRIIQMTPPGSGCSVTLMSGPEGPGGPPMRPGSLRGVQLVVADVRAAHAELAERGVPVGDVQVYAPEGIRPYQDGDDLNNVGFCFFDDPDGNGWAVQQITARD